MACISLGLFAAGSGSHRVFGHEASRLEAAPTEYLLPQRWFFKMRIAEVVGDTLKILSVSDCVEPALQERQPIDFQKLRVHAVMGETYSFLSDFYPFVILGRSGIAVGYGYFQDIGMPEQLSLQCFRILPHCAGSRQGKCQNILAAESEVRVIDELELPVDGQRSHDEDNRDGKLKDYHGFSEEGSLFSPCQLPLDYGHGLKGGEEEGRIDAGQKADKTETQKHQ